MRLVMLYKNTGNVCCYQNLTAPEMKPRDHVDLLLKKEQTVVHMRAHVLLFVFFAWGNQPKLTLARLAREHNR